MMLALPDREGPMKNIVHTRMHIAGVLWIVSSALVGAFMMPEPLGQPVLRAESSGSAASAEAAPSSPRKPSTKNNLFSERKGEQVKMFGASLDASMAGVKAGSRETILRVLKDDEGLDMNDMDRAEIFYAEAVHEMNKGRYPRAVELMNRAVPSLNFDPSLDFIFIFGPSVSCVRKL